MTALLCLHGSGHTSDSFRDQKRAFAECVPLSLPGHPDGQALGSVDDCVEWFEQYRRSNAFHRPVLAGNSLGGAIALAYTLRYPEALAGLVLIGTGARLKVARTIFGMLADRWPECIDDLVGYTLSATANPELRSRVKQWHMAVGRESTRLDYGACDEFDVMNQISSIRVPTLVIVGTDDRMTPVKYSEHLARSIAGSRLQVVEGSGHMPHAEQPSVVNSLIAEFISSCAPPDGDRTSQGNSR